MSIISIGSNDITWIRRDLYCKTPEALEIALTTLREIGYTVKDNRTDGYSAHQGVTPEQMERGGASLWFASLSDIRRGKCVSCGSLISTKGIRSHGHKCEVCGEVTYLEIIDGTTVRFSFVGDRGMFSPELNMKAQRWDADAGWLYLYPETLGYGGLSVISGDKAQEYLASHADKWETVEEDERPLVRIHYANDGYVHEDDVISVMDIWGGQFNHTIVRVWDGREYGEYDREFPLPEYISVFETWHWAPLPPSPTLHERLIHAVGQVARKDYYYQDGRPAWERSVYEEMGIFVREFTTLDADKWDRESQHFRLDGPGGIDDVARFCHPDAVVRNDPNIGNFLVGVSRIMSGQPVTEAEATAAVDALRLEETWDFMAALAAPRTMPRPLPNKLPRKLKKALRKPPSRRTWRERRHVVAYLKAHRRNQ